MNVSYNKCIIWRQLIDYVTSNSIVDCFQNAYLPNRSTETALNIVFNDIILSMDNKDSYYLVLLDLSSVFDMLNHRIISYHLREIGIHEQVYIGCCRLYLIEYLQ